MRYNRKGENVVINKVKVYRKIKNLTQEDLANQLGVTRKTINQIEIGNILPKIDIAYKLSIILDTTIEQLFFNKDYSEHYTKCQEESLEKIASVYFNLK